MPADDEDVADDEHPDHEHRIDRGSANCGIMRRQLAVDPGQVENGRDLAHEMVVRHRRIEIERIEQLALVSIVPTHHGPPPPTFTLRRRNHCSRRPITDFCNKIGQKETLRHDGVARPRRLSPDLAGLEACHQAVLRFRGREIELPPLVRVRPEPLVDRRIHNADLFKSFRERLRWSEVH